MPTEKKYRAGRYVTQTTGYKAFIPEPLPPKDILYDNVLRERLSKADRALGRLDGATEMLPNPELFVYMYIRKEAVLSSQIEGTQATLMDVLEYEALPTSAERVRDVAEVANYIRAINYGLKLLRDKEKGLPLSLRLFKEIHSVLLQNVRGSDRTPGEFRRSQNWIGPAGCTLNSATHVPPPSGQEMMKALGDLEMFFHSEEPIPQLVKIGLAHAQFETIHPFLDGNGRMGRLLITFYLCHQGILQHPLLYISHFFKKNRSEYYERLQAVRDKGEWEEWLKFFLWGIYSIAQGATDKARKIVHLREKHRELILEKIPTRSAGRALALLEHLFQSPLMNVGKTEKLLDISFSSANNLIGAMEKVGILTEITGQKRNRLYFYQPYFSLLDKDPDDEPM